MSAQTRGSAFSGKNAASLDVQLPAASPLREEGEALLRSLGFPEIDAARNVNYGPELHRHGGRSVLPTAYALDMARLILGA